MVCQTDLDKDSHIGSSSEILVYESHRSLNRRKLKNASPQRSTMIPNELANLDNSDNERASIHS